MPLSPESSNPPLPIEEGAVARPKYIESAAGDGTTREDQYLHGFPLVICFFSLFLCLFLVALDQTIVSTILSTVGNKFDAYDRVGWLLSGFLLALSVFIQPFGTISIIIGRKWAMIIGIVLFEIGSLVCALAPTMNALIGGRVLAGVGAAGIQSLVFVIVTEIVTINKRPVAMAIISCTFAIASVLGPLVGGAFTEHVTWRWAFYINLPIGGCALAFFFFTFKPPRGTINVKESLLRYDYVGTVLTIIWCVLLLLAFTWPGQGYAWSSAAVITCFVLLGVFCITWGWWNFFFCKNPLLPGKIVIRAGVLTAVGSIAGSFSFFIMLMVFLPIYFQVIRDRLALSAGLHLLPTIVAVVISSIISGVTIQKLRYIKPFALASAVLTPVGAGLLTLLDVDSPFSKQVGLLIVAGIGIGFMFQPAMLCAQISAPDIPGAIIIITAFSSFFRALLSAVSATLGNAVYSASINNIYKQRIGDASPEILAELQSYGVTARSLQASNSFLTSLTPETELFLKKIFMEAIRNAFYMGIGFAIIGSICACFVTNKRLPLPEDLQHNAEKEEKQVEEAEANGELPLALRLNELMEMDELKLRRTTLRLSEEGVLAK